MCFFYFRLVAFPTKLRNPKERQKWKHLINRVDEKGKIWSPSKDSRVCSRHFIDGGITQENPYPTEHLGYDCTSRVKNIEQCSKRRKLCYKKTDVQISTHDVENNLPANVENSYDEPENISYSSIDESSNVCGENTYSDESFSGTTKDYSQEDIDFEKYLQQKETYPSCSTVEEKKQTTNNSIINFLLLVLSIFSLSYIVKLHNNLQVLKNEVEALKMKKLSLSSKIKKLEKEAKNCTCKKSVHSQLLKTDKDVQLFTGLENKATFEKLHDYIAPFIKCRWKGVKRTVSKVRRNLNNTKKRGPERKLHSKDEFLLTLMKLRLALTLYDLAKRFKTSKALSGQIFTCWLRAMAQLMSSMIYMPEQGTINVTTPKRFYSVRNIHSIIDCSEIFIETPQDHDRQAMTWSTYKHHNTLKFLVAVAPNSSITYVSPAYTGRISDKELTVHCGYLEHVPPYTVLMCDKGFQLEEECTARRITHYIPPGKRGMSQMGSVEVAKTNKIAKMRILVEQVIRRMKIFKILSTELPISLIPQIDDILTVCAAITNMKEPIFVD